jgi:FkbM family methyltransferase
MGATSDLMKDVVTRSIRFVVRQTPPRGRGISLAHRWTRFNPPDDRQLVSKEPGGARLRCDLRDALSRVVFYRGWVDRGLEDWMVGWLRPGDLYVDVGAHIGYLTALAASAVGPSGRVVAFEPSPDTYAKLSAAFVGPAFAHVRAVHAAVAEVAGRTVLFAASGAWQDQAYRNSLHPGDGLLPTSEVEVVTLDEELGDSRVRLLKVDVEGGEVAVISGANRLLSDRRADALVVELNPPALARAGATVSDLVGELGGYGYDAHRITEGGVLQRWDPVEVEGEFADAVFLPR